MAALTDLSDLVNRATGGNSGTPETHFFFKTPYTSGTAVTWTSGLLYDFWLYDGFPSAGATPTTVAAPDNTSAGAIPFATPGGGRQKWLTQTAFTYPGSSEIPMMMLYDRLLHIGGLDGTVTTAQTVGGTLTRNTGGVGNKIMVEVYSSVGTTARTITASYTNQDGTASRTTETAPIGATLGTLGNEVTGWVELPLQAGDIGVQSVQDVTLSASTGTAGDFGVTIIKPLLWMQTGDSFRAFDDPLSGVNLIPEIESGACLAFGGLVTSASEVPFFGMLSSVEA